MEGSINHDGDMFKLIVDNYTCWKPMMEDHIYCKDFHASINQKGKPKEKIDNDWETDNRKVVSMIIKKNYLYMFR